jgi:hypothetical protein
MVMESLEALPHSPWRLLKKKPAPRWPLSAKVWLTVRDIADVPAQAMPFSQKILTFALASLGPIPGFGDRSLFACQDGLSRADIGRVGIESSTWSKR